MQCNVQTCRSLEHQLNGDMVPIFHKLMEERSLGSPQSSQPANMVSCPNIAVRCKHCAVTTDTFHLKRSKL